MATTTRRRHTKEFKLEAVRLCENSGKSIGQISRELDVPRNTLSRWRVELRADQQEALIRPSGGVAVMASVVPMPSGSGSSNARTSG